MWIYPYFFSNFGTHMKLDCHVYKNACQEILIKVRDLMTGNTSTMQNHQNIENMIILLIKFCSLYTTYSVFANTKCNHICIKTLASHTKGISIKTAMGNMHRFFLWLIDKSGTPDCFLIMQIIQGVLSANLYIHAKMSLYFHRV